MQGNASPSIGCPRQDQGKEQCKNPILRPAKTYLDCLGVKGLQGSEIVVGYIKQTAQHPLVPQVSIEHQPQSPKNQQHQHQQPPKAPEKASSPESKTAQHTTFAGAGQKLQPTTGKQQAQQDCAESQVRRRIGSPCIQLTQGRSMVGTEVLGQIVNLLTGCIAVTKNIPEPRVAWRAQRSGQEKHDQGRRQPGNGHLDHMLDGSHVQPPSTQTF